MSTDPHRPRSAAADMAADVSDDPRVSAAMRQIRDGVADLAAALTAIAAEHLARALRRRLPAGETDTATT